MKFNELGAKALRTIGVAGQGVGVSANNLKVAFEAANDMIDAWAAKRLTVFQTIRKVYPLVANKGGPLNPYTIGLGGDFDTPRPTWIPNANLNNLTTTPPFEYPMEVLKENEYAAIAIKDMASAQTTSLWFNGKFDTTGPAVGLGQIFLYPVPNGQTPCELVLYIPIPLMGFADQAQTDYTFPPGYAEALRYQLALRLASEFQKTLSPETLSLVTSTFALIEEANVPIPSIRSDFGLPGTGSAYGLYNWRTGTNSRRGDA